MDEAKLPIEFVKIQRRLLEGFLLLHPEFVNSKLLLDVPRKAELRIGDEIWDASRHGVGLLFQRREPAPNLVIDAHTNVDIPDFLDAWRIQQFVESTGATLRFEEADAMLMSGVETGELIRCSGGGYKLKC